MAEYVKDEKLEALGRVIIRDTERFQHLGGCRICYLRSDSSKKSGGKTVFADTQKLTDKVKAMCGLDFAITFYADSENISEKALRILMEHELMHVGWDGVCCSIVPHDVDDFRDILESHGFDWVSE